MRQKTVYFAFVSFLTAIISLTVNSALLLRLSVCMLLMIVLALSSVLTSLWTVRIQTGSGKFSLVRGEELEIPIQCRYNSLLIPGSIAYRSDFGPFVSFDTLPFRTTGKKLRKKFRHVGVYESHGGVVYVTDLFNFFVLSKKVKSQEIRVEAVPVSHFEKLPEIRSKEGEEQSEASQEDASMPSGIREWVDGDVLKRVHWKLSMKHFHPDNKRFKPLVKTYEEAARPDTLVIPLLGKIDAVDERASNLYDGICDCALGACETVIRKGNMVRLLICDHEDVNEISASKADEKKKIASALANADISQTISFETLVLQVMRRIETAGAAVFITTALTARDTDMLIRLHGYRTLNVGLLIITDTTGKETQPECLRLEASGIRTKVVSVNAEFGENT